MAGILEALASLNNTALPDNDIDRLKAKIAAREGKPGLKANVTDLRERLAKMEAGNA